MPKNKIILKTKKDTVLFANRFAKSLQQNNPPCPSQIKFGTGSYQGGNRTSPPDKGGWGVTVVALTGDLGVGKTFFTKALGKALGVKETIKSPSFNLIKIYEIPAETGRCSVETRQCLVSTVGQIKTLVHVDCYRLNSPEELIDIGLLDYFGYNNTLIVIEWADKIKKILPKDTIWMKFEIGKNNTRTVEINSKS